MTAALPHKSDAICRECCQPIPYDRAALESISGVAGEVIRKLRPTICNACDEQRCQREQAAILEGRTNLWRRMCPPLFIDTSMERLQQLAPRQLAAALAWQYGPKGVVMHGAPRVGKSRIAWLMLQKLIMDGYRPAAITSGEFAAKSARFTDGHAFAWKDELTEADALFIDDLGKFKATERVEADLFDVIDTMNCAKKPIIITTNGVGDTLLAQFSPERGPAIIERIREFCTPISFSKTK